MSFVCHALMLIVVGVAYSQVIPYTQVVCAASADACRMLEKNITAAIYSQAAPGMAIVALSPNGTIFEVYAGRFTYDNDSARVTARTMYDMASCTKVMATTTIAANLFQLGLLNLDERVGSPNLLGPSFSGQGKGTITVRQLLLHTAGFPPDPSPGYLSPNFDCANNLQYHPGQGMTCETAVFRSVLSQTLINTPGRVFVYSDLSMITLMFVEAVVIQNKKLLDRVPYPASCANRSSLVCTYQAYYATLLKKIDMLNTTFIPTDAIRTPPEWFDSSFRHERIMGYVSDENAYALGGISGHAGVFTTAADAARLMRVWLYGTHPSIVNTTTQRLFTTVANISMSSRALGWDTNQQAILWCGTFSPRAFLHIGFTGTELCGDPVSGVATVVLANGRYPAYNVDNMIAYRPIINTLLHDTFVG